MSWRRARLGVRGESLVYAPVIHGVVQALALELWLNVLRSVHTVPFDPVALTTNTPELLVSSLTARIIVSCANVRRALRIFLYRSLSSEMTS